MVAKQSGIKVFILISSIQTWALTTINKVCTHIFTFKLTGITSTASNCKIRGKLQLLKLIINIEFVIQSIKHTIK